MENDVITVTMRWGMLTTFPQCNFSQEFPEIHGQNYMLSLTKCGVLIIKHCEILVNVPYNTHHDKSIGFFCQCNSCSVFHIMVKASVLQYGENTQTFYASEFCIGRELYLCASWGLFSPNQIVIMLVASDKPKMAKCHRDRWDPRRGELL